MKWFQTLFVVPLIIVILVACSPAVTRVELNPAKKRLIRRIAIMETPEPSKYLLVPNVSAGAALGVMFGAIGGAVGGTIDVGRQNAASDRFTSAVAPLAPELNAALLDQLEAGLREKGYEIERIPMLPTTSDGKDYDVSKAQGEFDAVFTSSLAPGYACDWGEYMPRIFLRATLYSMSEREKMFANIYCYTAVNIDPFVCVKANPRFKFSSEDELNQRIELAVKGLRAGTKELAERVLADL